MHDATAVFSVSCALLTFLLAGLSLATALRRAKVKVFTNPEDAARFPGATVADFDHSDVARLVRVHRNVLENFVPYFALGTLWLGLGVSAGVAPWLFAVFTVSRGAHVALFLAKQSRARSVAHAIGFFVLIVLAGGVLYRMIA